MWGHGLSDWYLFELQILRYILGSLLPSVWILWPVAIVFSAPICYVEIYLEKTRVL